MTTTDETHAIDIGLRRKIRIIAVAVFETAWRVGSGREGETMADLGTLRAPDGQPILPGSSLKGKLRSTCESLTHALSLSACMLNCTASGVCCTSDVKYFRAVRDEYREACRSGPQSQMKWIDDHTCDVCRLFGSPVRAGRLRISDGTLRDWADVVQVRNGVVIDRDSHTAVDGLKFDYEVIPPGSRFELNIDIENPANRDLSLVGAALFEWSSGSSIGGFSSRGLGRFHLEEVRLFGIDLTQPEQRLRFLTATRAEDRLCDLGNWEEHFTEYIEQRLQEAEMNQAGRA